jgi:hypothetical protein
MAELRNSFVIAIVAFSKMKQKIDRFFIGAVLTKIFNMHLRNYEVKNLNTIRGRTESANLTLEALKYNPISGETVPFNNWLEMSCIGKQ